MNFTIFTCNITTFNADAYHWAFMSQKVVHNSKVEWKERTSFQLIIFQPEKKDP